MRIKFGEGARRGGHPPPHYGIARGRAGGGAEPPAPGSARPGAPAAPTGWHGPAPTLRPESITLANYLASEEFSKLLPGTPR